MEDIAKEDIVKEDIAKDDIAKNDISEAASKDVVKNDIAKNDISNDVVKDNISKGNTAKDEIAKDISEDAVKDIAKDDISKEVVKDDNSMEKTAPEQTAQSDIPQETAAPILRQTDDNDESSTRARKLANRSSLLLGMSSGASIEEESEAENKDGQDSRTSISNSVSDHMSKDNHMEKPMLPPRPSNPKTNPQLDLPKNYGLDRVASEPVELESPSKTQPTGISSEDCSQDGQTMTEKVLKKLLRERAGAVDDVIHSMPEELRISADQYLQILHSSDELIEILSEVESGNYTNPDREAVFSLISGSLKISNAVENADVSNLDADLFKDTVHSLSVTKPFDEDKLIKDMMKICAIVGETAPNPLVCYIHTQVQSIKTCLVLELIMRKFVTSNSEFEFLLLRSLEARDPELIVKKYNSGELSLVQLKDSIASGKVWLDLIAKAEDAGLGAELVKNSIVYGFKSLIDALIACVILPKDGKLTNLTVQSDLCRYHREYSIIKENSEAFSTDNTVMKERETLEFFHQDLKKKKQAYTDLLNNYKQLNEEKFSNENALKKLKMENEELRKKLDDSKTELSSKLSGFEVIKINNDKNEEISKMNENLRNEIARVSTEISELSLKLKK